MKDKTKNERYKVIVWGPGKMGSYAMHYFITNDAFELIGVRGYFENEINIDAGEFLGLDPIGVIMTDNEESLLAMDADCVLYTVHEDPNYATDAEILRILESGKNVVTTLPYHNIGNFRAPEIVEKFEEVCERSSYHRSMGRIKWCTGSVTVLRIWQNSRRSEEKRKSVCKFCKLSKNSSVYGRRRFWGKI